MSNIEQRGLLLQGMPAESLQQHISDLRNRLVYSGCNDNLAIEAFATVRELSDRILGMRHFESQLLGGWAMYQGKIAEMQTGEGKTLTAVLPAATAAMAGIPVHVITVNDYLATRDAGLMRPLYESLGLSVGVVTEGLDFKSRRAAYCCDITYTTNKQICFDYLRDRIERGSNTGNLNLKLACLRGEASKNVNLMLRGLCFAIIDEADSVLIDDAGTPLILSRAVEKDDPMLTMYRQALVLGNELLPGKDYVLCESKRTVALTPKGHLCLERCAIGMDEAWHMPRRRNELVEQALVAEHLFKRDRDYVVHEKKVQIVDGNTGRLMADRSWGRGLHQMIEIKEQCTLSANNETLARISYQRFFHRYLKISGMTGTACELKRELRKVYGLGVVRIPTHRACRRIAIPEKIYLSVGHAHAAVVASALALSALGRPVLIGTKSVLQSELIAQRLLEAGTEVQVLNAQQDVDEANVIAQAGNAGLITVATNMAGRGTDIHLGGGVAAIGGLHVILTERNDAKRIDRQLLGRCARQGDAGSYQIISSLEDELPRQIYGESFIILLSVFVHRKSNLLPCWIGSRVFNFAQRRREQTSERARRFVEREDERLSTILSFSGEPE